MNFTNPQLKQGLLHPIIEQTEELEDENSNESNELIESIAHKLGVKTDDKEFYSKFTQILDEHKLEIKKRNRPCYSSFLFACIIDSIVVAYGVLIIIITCLTF